MTSKKNGKTLFLPAAGSCSDDALSQVDKFGYYCSADLFTLSNRACYLKIKSSEWDANNSLYRNFGFSVRPVISSAE